jgi:hypothetical protein
MRHIILVCVLATAAPAAPDNYDDLSHDDFAFALHEYTGEYARTWLVTRVHTFQVGKKCLARFADKQQAVIASAAQVGTHIEDYAKARGADDWSTVESQHANTHEANRKLVYDMIEGWRGKLSITIKVEGDDCDAGDRALWLQYWTSIAKALEDYPPKAGKVAIVLDVTARAKTLTASIAKDGTFVFTAPRDIEANNWLAPIESTFRRAARK